MKPAIQHMSESVPTFGDNFLFFHLESKYYPVLFESPLFLINLVPLAFIDDLLRCVSNSIPREWVQEFQPKFYNCESKLHKKSKGVLRCFPSQFFKTKNSKTLESHNLIVSIVGLIFDDESDGVIEILIFEIP